MPAHGLPQTEALAAEDHDAAVVDQAVDEGGGQPAVAEHGIPLTEFEVGGDNETFLLIAVADDLEEELGSDPLRRAWEKAPSSVAS